MNNPPASAFAPWLGAPANQNDGDSLDELMADLLLACPQTVRDALDLDAFRVRNALLAMALERPLSPPGLSRIARRVGLPESAIARALAELHQLGMVRTDDRGAIAAVHPLSFHATGYHVDLAGVADGHALSGVAALAVPALLGAFTPITTVSSVCPVSESRIAISSSAGRILEISPSGAHLGWSSVRDRSHLFADRNAAESYFAALGEAAGVVAVEVAFRARARICGEP